MNKFKVGDKVIVTNAARKIRGYFADYFNGDTGYISAISSKKVYVDFDQPSITGKDRVGYSTLSEELELLEVYNSPLYQALL